mgnify:CR=1
MSRGKVRAAESVEGAMVQRSVVGGGEGGGTDGELEASGIPVRSSS